MRRRGRGWLEFGTDLEVGRRGGRRLVASCQIQRRELSTGTDGLSQHWFIVTGRRISYDFETHFDLGEECARELWYSCEGRQGVYKLTALHFLEVIKKTAQLVVHKLSWIPLGSRVA